MDPTFGANHNIGCQIAGLRIAVIHLCLAGYVMLEARTSSSKEMAQIKLEQPFDCEDSQLSPDGLFGSVERWGCRLYWAIN